MAIYDAPDGSQFVAPDWLAPPAQPDAYGMTPYDAGAFAPETQATTPSMENYYGGLPPAVLERIAPGLASQGVSPMQEPQISGVLPSFAQPEPSQDYRQELAPEVAAAQAAPPPKPVAPAKVTPAKTAPADPYAQATTGALSAIDKMKAAQADQAASDIGAADEILRIEQQGAALEQEAAEATAAKQAEVEAERVSRLKQVDDAVTRHAAMKIDRGRNLSGAGRQILAGISVLLSGIGDAIAKKNGPNAAMQIILNAIDKDVEDQVKERESAKDEISLRRNSLDEYTKIGGDMIAAKEFKRAELMKQTAREIRLVAAKHGAEAVRVRGEMEAAKLDQLAASTLEGAAKEAFLRDVQKENLRLERGRLGYQFAALKQGDDHFKATREDRKAEMDAAREIAARNAIATMGVEKAKLVQERGIGSPPRMVVDENGQPVPGPDGQPQILRGEALMNGPGDPFLPSEKNAPIVTKRMITARQLADIYNKLIALRGKFGGESRALNSDESQQMQGLAAQALKLTKADTEGMSSDEDMNVLREAGGIKDVDSFRAKMVGIEQGLEFMYSNLDATLETALYKGPKIRFANPYAQKAGLTADEEEFKRAVDKPTMRDMVGDADYERQINAGLEAKYGPSWRNYPVARTEYGIEARRLRDAHIAATKGGATPAQVETYEKWGELARNGTADESRKAREKLNKALDEAKTEGARSKIRQVIMSTNPSPDSGRSSGPVTSTAKDSIDPRALKK